MWHFKSLISVICGLIYSFPAASSTVLEAVQVGLNNNVSLIASRKGVEESAYNIDVSRSNFLPTISADVKTTWNSSSTRLSGIGDNESAYNDHGYGISLSQTLFNLSDIYAYGTSKLDLSIEEVKNEAKTQEIIEQITAQYFEYLKNGAKTRATKAELESSMSQLTQMNRNVSLGNVAASELYEVVAQKEGIANRLRSLHKDKEVILNRLSLLTQYPLIPSQDLKSQVLLTEIPFDKQTDLLGQAMKFNNDIILSQKTLERSFRTLKETGSNFTPNLSANASYRHEDTNNFDLSSNPNATGISDDRSLGLVLTVPITTGGSDYYAYQKNKKTIERKRFAVNR